MTGPQLLSVAEVARIAELESNYQDLAKHHEEMQASTIRGSFQDRARIARLESALNETGNYDCHFCADSGWYAGLRCAYCYRGRSEI